MSLVTQTLTPFQLTHCPLGSALVVSLLLVAFFPPAVKKITDDLQPCELAGFACSQFRVAKPMEECVFP